MYRCEQRRLDSKDSGYPEMGKSSYKLGAKSSERSRRMKRLNPYLSARSCPSSFFANQEESLEFCSNAEPRQIAISQFCPPMVDKIGTEFGL